MCNVLSYVSSHFLYRFYIYIAPCQLLIKYILHMEAKDQMPNVSGGDQDFFVRKTRELKAKSKPAHHSVNINFQEIAESNTSSKIYLNITVMVVSSFLA